MRHTIETGLMSVARGADETVKSPATGWQVGDGRTDVPSDFGDGKADLSNPLIKGGLQVHGTSMSVLTSN